MFPLRPFAHRRGQSAVSTFARYPRLVLLLLGVACHGSTAEIEPLPSEPYPGARGIALEQLDRAAAAVRETEGGGSPGPAARGAAWFELATAAHAYDVPRLARLAYANAAALGHEPARSHYLRGVLALEGGDPAAARDDFDRALRSDSSNPRIRIASARARMAIGDADSAERTIDDVLQRLPTDAGALLAGAEIAAQSGRPERAVERYENLLRLQPAATRIFDALAPLYRRVGRTEDADRASRMAERTGVAKIEDPWLTAVRAGRPDRDSLAREATAAFERGELERASTLFEELLVLEPDSDETRLNLAATRLRQGRGDEARKWLDPLVTPESTVARAWFVLGALEMQRGDLDASVRAYRRALELEPGDGAARLNLANALLRSRRHADAQREYATLLTADPASSGARVGAAAAQTARGRYAEARELLEESFDPRTAAPHVTLALARVLACAPVGAVRDGERAARLVRGIAGHESSSPAMEALAMSEMEAGRRDAAIAAQERSLALARASGATSIRTLERLEANLLAYRRGEPCRDPALF